MNPRLRRLLPLAMIDGLRYAIAARRAQRALPPTSRGMATRPHRLPNSLYISLTSFPKRFATLHLTLRSLRRQTIGAYAILLWIARSEVALLPRKVRAEEANGLRIIPCDDLRSYNKLVHALAAYPDAFLVTADDDLFYPPDWLEQLVSAAEPGRRLIPCHRAHRVTPARDGGLAPYFDWPHDVQDEAAHRPSRDLLATGVGGVLYPPGCFDADVLDREAFGRLSPDGDDLWFYWMAHRAGASHKKVGPRFRQIKWLAAQESLLFDANRRGGNDRAIQALEDALGVPLTGARPHDRGD